MPGRLLHRLARRSCSPDLCHTVVEPAIADLQHEYDAARSSAGASAGRLRALVVGYATVWLVWTVAIGGPFGWQLTRLMGLAAALAAAFAFRAARQDGPFTTT